MNEDLQMSEEVDTSKQPATKIVYSRESLQEADREGPRCRSQLYLNNHDSIASMAETDLNKNVSLLKDKR